VMEAGQIVGNGTHASLLAEGGAYARPYEAQFAAPAAEVQVASRRDASFNFNGRWPRRRKKRLCWLVRYG
jgi:hypothetical protein